ncbi:hypothetical protein MLP_04820 [Microlunatus phosphovorus NM-1]|uniref:Uncharacterized protein n=1 Tax=Microlunatus phosphovorus (strain ATCC 700054 / DSM 10555 / JCM 9379 / NBRC 101784 / NCIMB 13414 / VKM Ac-1990 / NM-1) TaxID=1032480 RepID=F5XK00_MICPN|nr:hypothetical protein MLP_04820 [Microlunatus phosphovorus NM-1]
MTVDGHRLFTARSGHKPDISDTPLATRHRQPDVVVDIYVGGIVRPSKLQAAWLA